MSLATARIFLSVQQGIDHLKEQRPDVVEFVLVGNRQDLCLAVNASAELLAAALEKNIKHTSITFGAALAQLFHQAEVEMMYRLTEHVTSSGNRALTLRLT